ncbi:hypothetical protein U1Q18_045487 [Sarracenia purpurea var. burkii]
MKILSTTRMGLLRASVRELESVWISRNPSAEAYIFQLYGPWLRYRGPGFKTQGTNDRMNHEPSKEHNKHVTDTWEKVEESVDGGRSTSQCWRQTLAEAPAKKADKDVDFSGIIGEIPGDKDMGRLPIVPNLTKISQSGTEQSLHFRCPPQMSHQLGVMGELLPITHTHMGPLHGSSQPGIATGRGSHSGPLPNIIEDDLTPAHFQVEVEKPSCEVGPGL